MPHYHWNAVDIHASRHKGKQFALDRNHLDQLLLKRGLALTRIRSARILRMGVSLNRRADVVRQLSTLLSAGIHVPQALELIAYNSPCLITQECLYTSAHAVNDGVRLSDALAQHPLLCSPLMCELVSIGQESGSLAQALQVLAEHLDARKAYSAQVRAALAMPIITILFFFIIVSIIITVILPQFAQLFANFDQALPRSTRLLLDISNYVSKWHVGVLLAAVAMSSIVAKRMARCAPIRMRRDRFMMKVPGIGQMIKDRASGHALHVLAVLLSSGVHLSAALRILVATITHTHYVEQFKKVEEHVQAGSSLSNSLAVHALHLFGPDTVAMLRVAEESGTMVKLLERMALAHQHRAHDRLSRLITFLQPALIVVLGCLIALLILSVYSPLLTLSSRI